MNLIKYALALVLITTFGSPEAAPGTPHEARYTDLLVLLDPADNRIRIPSVASVAPMFGRSAPTDGGAVWANSIPTGIGDISRFSDRGRTNLVSNDILFGASLADFLRVPVNFPTTAHASLHSTLSKFDGEIPGSPMKKLGLPGSDTSFDASPRPASEVMPLPRAVWLLGSICLVGLIGIARLMYAGFS